MKKLINILILLSFVFIANAQLYIKNVNFVMTSGSLTVSNMNFKNDGTFTAGTGTVNFTGTVEQNIQGTSLSTFNNIKINNSSNLIADVNFDVKVNLEFSSGDLDLKNSIVSLGTTGAIVNESSTNRIKVGDANNNTGTITIDRAINNDTYDYLELSNIGIEIITDKNLGSITIVRGHQIQVGMDSNESIERYFIIPGIDTITSTNYIRMKYFDIEQNSILDADLQFFQTVSYGSDMWWTPCSTSIASNEADFTHPTYDTWIYEHSITFNDKFTLASKNDPLPVELINFIYDCETASLNWTTASEINNDYFIVEKSYDVINWERITKIDGNGNSNTENHYEYNIKDNNVYYRLIQVDYDGIKTYHDIIYVACESDIFDVYPVPVNHSEFINICCDDIESLEVIDMVGQNIQFIREGNSIKIDIPGTYILIINKTQVEKIIIH